jgi:hypothetical protein
MDERRLRHDGKLKNQGLILAPTAAHFSVYLKSAQGLRFSAITALYYPQSGKFFTPRAV